MAADPFSKQFRWSMVPAHVFSESTQRRACLDAELAHIAFVFNMLRFNVVEDIVSVL